MATQSEIINYFNANYAHEEPTPGLYRAPFTTTNGRQQQVIFFVNEQFATFSSPFATTNQVKAQKVLEAASEHSIFGVFLVGNEYTVHHIIPIKDIDPSEIDFAFGWVSGFADKLEGILSFKDNF